MQRRYLSVRPSKPQIDNDTSFTDIFAGILNEYYKAERIRLFGHAVVVPYATKFFKERTVKGVNPAEVVSHSLLAGGPFVPGVSILSTDLERLFGIETEPFADDFLRYKQGKENAKHLLNLRGVLGEERFTELSVMGLEQLVREAERHSLMSNITSQNAVMIEYFEDGDITKKREIPINHRDYTRVFAQILTGALNAAHESGFKPVLRVPVFYGVGPNHIRGLAPNYLGEGMHQGTLMINGNAGDLIGKHAKGGTIVVGGRVGKNLGDCASEVEFIIGNEDVYESGAMYHEPVQSITQADNCRFWVRGGFMYGKISAKNSEFHFSHAHLPRLDGELIASPAEKERYFQEQEKDGNKFTQEDETVERKYLDTMKEIIG